MAIDSYWGSVALLLPFDGANNSTAIVDVIGHPIRVHGDAKLSTAQAPTGCTSSLLLDGNNDYIRVGIAAYVADYDFASMTSDFSIEFSFYRVGDTTSGAGNDAVLINFKTINSSQVAPYLTVDGSASATPGKISFTINGSKVITSTTAMTTAWKSIVLARVSGTTRLFIDGTQEGSSYTDSNTYNVSAMTIGGTTYESSGDFRSPNGYIGPIRITHHGRGYSANFTPPALPFPRPQIKGTVYDETAAPASRTVLVHDRTGQFVGGAVSSASTGEYRVYTPSFHEYQASRADEVFDPIDDETLVDLVIPNVFSRGQISDSRGHTLVAYQEANQPSIVTTNPPYPGMSSLYCAAGRYPLYVSTADEDFKLWKQDFSLEMMFYPVTGGHGAADAYLFSIGSRNIEGQVFAVCNASDNPAKIQLYVYTGGAAVALWSLVATTVANDTWHKLQLRRVNNVFELIINGTVWGSASSNIEAGDGTLWIAGSSANSQFFKGNIGPFRLSRGPRRAGQATPTTNFLKPRPLSSAVENAQIYDRVIPVGS